MRRVSDDRDVLARVALGAERVGHQDGRLTLVDPEGDPFTLSRDTLSPDVAA